MDWVTNKYAYIKKGIFTENNVMIIRFCVQDYPSVSQIASKLRDKSTNIIFAVMPDVVSHYMRLENFLLGSSVGTLESQSGNIIQLIRDNYDVSQDVSRKR